jgi:hypothetical protein
MEASAFSVKVSLGLSDFALINEKVMKIEHERNKQSIKL